MPNKYLNYDIFNIWHLQVAKQIFDLWYCQYLIFAGCQTNIQFMIFSIFDICRQPNKYLNDDIFNIWYLQVARWSSLPQTQRANQLLASFKPTIACLWVANMMMMMMMMTIMMRRGMMTMMLMMVTVQNLSTASLWIKISCMSYFGLSRNIFRAHSAD